jgi:hypothetical protein
VQYQPPPAFGPPESRVGPLRPEEAMALLTQQPSPPAAQAYPAPAYPAPAYATPLYPPPANSSYPAPRRIRRRGLVATAVAATALIVAGILAIAGPGSTTRHARSIRLPDAAGDYQLIRAIDGSTIESVLGTQLGSLGAMQDALDKAKVGVYGVGPAASATIVFLGFNASDSSSIDNLLASTDAKSVVSQVMAGTGGNSPTTISPGPLGGALACSQTIADGTSFTPCAWADDDTLAVVMEVGLVDVNDAGATTLLFRSAAEH